MEHHTVLNTVKAAQFVQKSGIFKTTTLVNPAQPEQRATVMIDPYLTPPELIILGGWHIAVTLANIGNMLGYKVTIIDDRPEFV